MSALPQPSIVGSTVSPFVQHVNDYLNMAKTQPSGMLVVQEQITPEYAEYLLSLNYNNRKLSPARVQAFRSAIERGEYKVTHQGVAVSNEPSLLDGQHRLTAIAEGGHTLTMLVSYGLDRSTFTVLDQQKIRSGGDVLAMKNVVNSVKVAAAYRLLHAVAHGMVKSRHVSNDMINEMHTNCPQVANFSKMGESVSKTLGAGTATSFMAAFWFISQIDKGVADEYIHKLSTGEMLEDGNPILACRNWLNYRRNEKTRVESIEYFKAVYHTFKDYSNNSVLKRLNNTRISKSIDRNDDHILNYFRV